VGVYDVSDPAAPAWRDQELWTGGRVTTVAARKNLVAAGRKDGTVILFSTHGGDSMEEEARFEVLGRIERLRFHGGFLWALGQGDGWVQVWDVKDPSSPLEVGVFHDGATEHFHSRILGSLGITFNGREVEALRFQDLAGGE